MEKETRFLDSQVGKYKTSREPELTDLRDSSGSLHSDVLICRIGYTV